MAIFKAVWVPKLYFSIIVGVLIGFLVFKVIEHFQNNNDYDDYENFDDEDNNYRDDYKDDYNNNN